MVKVRRKTLKLSSCQGQVLLQLVAVIGKTVLAGYVPGV